MKILLLIYFILLFIKNKDIDKEMNKIEKELDKISKVKYNITYTGNNKNIEKKDIPIKNNTSNNSDSIENNPKKLDTEKTDSTVKNNNSHNNNPVVKDSKKHYKFKKNHFIDEFIILFDFEINNNELKTFNFDITKETKECKFSISTFVKQSNKLDYSNLNYNIKITSPDNKEVYKNDFNKNIKNEKKNLDFNTIGNYIIDIKNEEDDNKIIEMEIELIKCHYIPKKADKKYLLEIKEKLSKQYIKINNIIEESNFLEVKEIMEFSKRQKLYKKVIYGTLSECLALFIISIAQIFFLKNLLDNKQLI